MKGVFPIAANDPLPMTLLAKELFLRVARPRSPILTEPDVPVMKMLSHFRSRWMMGGCRVCRKWRPFRIWRHQLRSTRFFTPLNRLRYLMVQTRWIEVLKYKNWDITFSRHFTKLHTYNVKIMDDIEIFNLFCCYSSFVFYMRDEVVEVHFDSSALRCNTHLWCKHDGSNVIRL